MIKAEMETGGRGVHVIFDGTAADVIEEASAIVANVATQIGAASRMFDDNLTAGVVFGQIISNAVELLADKRSASEALEAVGIQQPEPQETPQASEVSPTRRRRRRCEGGRVSLS